MMNKLRTLLAGQLAGWAFSVSAFVKRRQHLLLNLGIGAVGLFGLALLRQALTVDAAGVAQGAALLSAYHKSGMIAMLFFSAIASGYAYSCLQILGGATPESLRRRHALLSNLAFAATVGSALGALLLWNATVLLGGAGAG